MSEMFEKEEELRELESKLNPVSVPRALKILKRDPIFGGLSARKYAREFLHDLFSVEIQHHRGRCLAVDVGVDRKLKSIAITIPSKCIGILISKRGTVSIYHDVIYEYEWDGGNNKVYYKRKLKQLLYYSSS